MTVDSETTALMHTIVIACVALPLIAKICWECGLEAFRRRLYVLDAELFEFARHGRVCTGNPAYAMLRDSIRSMIRFSRRITLSEHLVTVLLRRPSLPIQAVERHSREWTEALSHVRSAATRGDLADFRNELLIDVSGYVTFGAVPLASALTNAIARRQVFDRCRRFALRNASLIEIQARHQERLAAAA